MTHGLKVIKYDVVKNSLVETKELAYAILMKQEVLDPPIFAVDELTQNIYFVAQDVDVMNKTMLYCFNLKTQKVEGMEPTLNFPSDRIAHIVFINGQIHGINYNGYHWMVKDYELSKLSHELPVTARAVPGHAIYIRSRSMILLICGHRNIKFTYSLKTHKLTRIHSAVLPFEMWNFGAVLTSNEGYIILMNGNKYRSVVDNVYVLDIRNEDENKWKLKKSSIKCPRRGKCTAIRTGGVDSKRDVLVNGFVKDCFKQKEFEDLQLPPSYIVKIVENLYSAEMIHWIHEDGEHCGIYLKDILSSLS